ncbi:transketolase [Lentzea albidocapillata subsp. violacea]|uniref:Transketolase n=1 Tax=Lentzea albidocapillata subsp. violacea TaxID=128104 RepID=A0A1G8UCD7_9PSEU|nr:transketolase C-terminal domain-containing protein [Lentzea albidocapillata]SDJ51392.1 transketolase [Lentzea albidocapillata subsp. violacea]
MSRHTAAGLANLEVLDTTLRDLASSDPAIRVLTADSRISGRLGPFAREFPDRLVELGIAEQNLVGVAAGLASCGMKPFVISPACFLTARALEQIKVDVGYSGTAVRLVGISAGISYGALGASHHSIADYAALRAIPGIPVVAPADNCEAEAAIRLAAATDGPLYIRLGKRALACVHGPTSEPVAIEHATRLRTGDDIGIIATGETVGIALEAAEALALGGVEATVVSMPMVRPLDTATLFGVARRVGGLIVAEEHSVHGGLGEACAAALMTEGIPVRFRALGIPDEPIVNGPQLDVLAHYGIGPEQLAALARELLV